jgi:hypothetical protein
MISFLTASIRASSGKAANAFCFASLRYSRLLKTIKPESVSLKPDDFEKLLVRAANGDPCFEEVFYTDNDSELSDLKAITGPTLNTFPVTGYLQYLGSRHDSPSEVHLSGLGVVRRAPRPECR